MVCLGNTMYLIARSCQVISRISRDFPGFSMRSCVSCTSTFLRRAPSGIHRWADPECCSEQGELLGGCGGAPARSGDLRGLWRLLGAKCLGAGHGSWAVGGGRSPGQGAGARPADAVFFRELADLAGDPVLVGLRGVGATAIQFQVPRSEEHTSE